MPKSPLCKPVEAPALSVAIYFSASYLQHAAVVLLKPEELICLPDLEAAAQGRMTPMAFGYVAGAAADELTLRANIEDWQRIRLMSRVLVDVSEIKLETTLLGNTLPSPILLAPTAFHRLCHPQGELATVEGANQGGAAMVVSSFSTEPVEAIAAIAKHPLWFQLYAQADRELTRDLIARARQAGYRAICLTVDTPVLGARHREVRHRFQLPADFQLPNLKLGSVSHRPVRGAIYSELLNPALNWKDIEWICSTAEVPVLLKGIMNPDDAERALDSGCGGIIVSNHGGRNLDTLPSTAAALPRIVQKAGGRMPILVDGGIRRGTDVLKAIALGADAVLVGRPYLYALALAGAAGVARVLEILRSELMMAMALTGRRNIKEIDRSALWD